MLERLGAFVKQGVPGPMRPGGSLLCKGIWRLDKPLLFNDFWPSESSPPATEVWFTRTGDSLLCKGIGRLDKPLLFNDFWRSENSPPATEVWFTRTGASLLCKGIGRLDKPLLFNDFWRSENSPPATEVWFRCAPPHVASLINGNGVVDRKLLMSREPPGLCASPPCHHQEYRERAPFLAAARHLEYVRERDIQKPRRLGQFAKRRALKSAVDMVGVVPVKRPVFLVEIRDAQISSGVHKCMELLKDLASVVDMVERHRAIDEVEARVRQRLGRKVEVQRAHILGAGLFDLLAQHGEHPLGGVCQEDRPQVFAQLKAELAGPATIVEGRHIVAKRHGRANCLGDLRGACEFLGRVPCAGFGVEF